MPFVMSGIFSRNRRKPETGILKTTERPDVFVTKYRNNGGRWIENEFENRAGG